MKIVLQTEASECSLACLAMVSSHFGNNLDIANLRRKFSISLKGTTLLQLIRHAALIGLAARPLRLDLDELSKLKLPAILHWNLNHFVVFSSIKKRWGRTEFIIFDPAVGERRMSMQEVSRYFTGVALECMPTEAFVIEDEARSMPLSTLTGKILGLRSAAIKVILLAFSLEVFAVVAPLFNQLVIDEVMVSGDHDLLVILSLGFSILLITQTGIGLARSWILMRWSIDIGLQWTARVLAHLIRLPLSFFEKRHLGDVVSRFGSIGAIQSTLTSVFVESLLDGLMALLALFIMLSYSTKLSIVVISSLIIYLGLRWIFYGPLREAAQERLVLSARENTFFIETIRAIAPIKLFGQEAERLARWQNLKQDVINRDIKTQKLGISFKTLNVAITGVQNLTVFYIGANLVIENQLTVGMLMAFSSYSTTFASRVFSLIDLFINTRMLTLHTRRLADIVMEEVEAEAVTETDVSRLQPSITLRNVKFRYGEGERWVLDGVTLHIPAGQSVAFVGSSGCGKTTLCKIILGLLRPTEGEVLIGGVNIEHIGVRAYRQLVGTVMQDDVLLAGSIYENICFFDGFGKMEQVIQCARWAAIHDEIESMPMGYQSLVGDMGTTLSGGQKQRVLLARALYKNPKILALDEATSHLDIHNERRVNDAMARLSLTRIMVAHRPETIASAERVVTLVEGRIQESGELNAA